MIRISDQILANLDTYPIDVKSQELLAKLLELRLNVLNMIESILIDDDKYDNTILDSTELIMPMLYFDYLSSTTFVTMNLGGQLFIGRISDANAMESIKNFFNELIDNVSISDILEEMNEVYLEAIKNATR